MFSWLKSLLSPPTPVGSPRLLKSFRDRSDALCPEADLVWPGEWRLPDRHSGFAILFQIESPEIEQCLVTFRAELRAECPLHKVHLEALARLTDSDQRVARTSPSELKPDGAWSFFETNLHLDRGERPSLLRFGLATEDPGTLYIRDVQVLVTQVA